MVGFVMIVPRIKMCYSYRTTIGPRLARDRYSHSMIVFCIPRIPDHLSPNPPRIQHPKQTQNRLFVGDRKFLPCSSLILSPNDFPPRSASRPASRGGREGADPQSLIFSSLACSRALSLSWGPCPKTFSCAKSIATPVVNYLAEQQRMGEWRNTFIQVIFLLLASLPTAESVVDTVHYPRR